MRDERHPLFFFLVALQLMSGQKVTVCAAVAPPQRAEPATAVTAVPFCLFYCVVITAETSVLSGGVTASASANELSSLALYVTKMSFFKKKKKEKRKEMMVCSQKTRSGFSVTI